jgi:hypothetical protein
MDSGRNTGVLVLCEKPANAALDNAFARFRFRGEWIQIDFLDDASTMLAIPCATNTRLCSWLCFYFQSSGQSKVNHPRLSSQSTPLTPALQSRLQCSAFSSKT